MYAHFKKLDYFSTECIYAPNAYRGYARTYLKDLESIRPSVIMDIIYSGETMQFVDTPSCTPTQGTCERCGFVASNKLCKACVLLEALNKGKPKLAVGKARDQRQLADYPEIKEESNCGKNSTGGDDCKCNKSSVSGLNKEAQGHIEKGSGDSENSKKQSIDF